MTKINISLIKADEGGWQGHATVQPALKKTADPVLAHEKDRVETFALDVMSKSDNHQLIVTQSSGENDTNICDLTWEVKWSAMEKEDELMTAKATLTGMEEANSISWDDLRRFYWIWSLIRWIIVLFGIFKDPGVWRLTIQDGSSWPNLTGGIANE